MMDITCDSDKLADAVELASRGVTGRSTQPVQNNIFMSADGDRLTLIGTDMELVSINTQIECDIEGKGSTTAPTRILTDVVSNLPGDDVHIGVDENAKLSIQSGSIDYSLDGLPAEEFQMFPDIEEDAEEFSIEEWQLYDAITKTVFATSTDQTRPILTGALFEFEEGNMRVVATDTFRLAMKDVGISGNFEEPMATIVSAQALDEITGIIDAKSDAIVHCRMTDNQIEFLTEDTAIASRLIVGQFPNYDKVMPDNSNVFEVDARTLRTTLNRIMVVAREDANRVVFDIGDDVVGLSAESADVGEVSEEIDAVCEGDEIVAAFNGRYFLDLLGAVKEGDIQVWYEEPLNPILIESADDDDYTNVLMPMQIM